MNIEIEGWYPSQQDPEAIYCILVYEEDAPKILVESYEEDGQEAPLDGPAYNMMLEKAFMGMNEGRDDYE